MRENWARRKNSNCAFNDQRLSHVRQGQVEAGRIGTRLVFLN